MTDRRLTFVEATSLMVGAGVGAGIMAVPYLAERTGLVGLAVILPIAWAASSIVIGKSAAKMSINLIN